MAQWVKNSTTVAQVIVEARVQSLAWCSGLKGLVLPGIEFLLQQEFNPWPRNFHMPLGTVIKTKNKTSTHCELFDHSIYPECIGWWL